MLFNSLEFLYLFLPVTFIVFWQLRTKQARFVWLTLTGYIFYSFWNYKFCALMLFSTLISYFAGVVLLKSQNPRTRKLCVTLSVAIDLSVLGFFKYYNFFIDSINPILVRLSPETLLPTLEIVLPIGISFYTFHTITYVIDAYQRKIKPTANFFEFSCYVSLFSQLVAGPIVRFGEIEKDLANIDRSTGVRNKERAWFFISVGMIKKVIIADSLAAHVDPALARFETLSTPEAWLCALGYSYQLYFDFSGYSDLAVGLGLLFNITIPQNFNSPFKALDIRDFWRRWHISLSRCLRDYLYIPLGGNRFGQWLTYRNIFITMLLGGLWHGANWTFVVWGIFHGVLLILNHRFAGLIEQLPTRLCQVITFLLVVIGFVVFRCESLDMALHIYDRMFSLDWTLSFSAYEGFCVWVLIAAIVAHTAPNTFERLGVSSKLETIGITVLFAIALARIYAGAPSPFLYFQF